MVANGETKLVKCSNCTKAFYIKTDKKGVQKITCPFCEEYTTVKINGGVKVIDDTDNGDP
jgi:hypothetical protein